MSDAQNGPVRRAPSELSTDDMAIRQKSPILDVRPDTEDIVVTDQVLHQDYTEALRFMEEPMTIVIQRSGDKNPAPYIDCWVNGVGAELLINGRWVKSGFLPVGLKLTTKRKYVEVLAKAKTDTVNTRHEGADQERPRNWVERYTSMRAPFQVIEDKNPKGADWLAGLVNFA